jgi:transcriptional regulator with XRE-family HTH domain
VGREPKSAAERAAFGERLKRLRVSRGLFLTDLAAPGAGAPYLSRVEHGERYPSVEVLHMLARRLGVTVSYLQTGDPVSRREGCELRLLEAELELAGGGDAAAAAVDLEALLGDPELAERSPLRTRTLLAHARGLLALGEGEQALPVFEALRWERLLTAAYRPQLLEELASCYLACARPASAIELINQTFNAPAPPEQEQELRLRLGLVLAGLEPAFGQQARAAELLRQATEEEQEPLSITLAGRLRAQAEEARERGEGEEARRLLTGACALVELEASARRLGAANLQLARTLHAAAIEAEALAALARAEPLLTSIRPGRELGLLRAEQARAAARTGHSDAAIGCAEQALELLPTDDPERGLACHARALAALAAGQHEQAGQWFRQAIDDHATHMNYRAAAQAAQDWAHALHTAGQIEKAAGVLDEATRLHLQRLRQHGGRAGRPQASLRPR